MPVLGKVVRLDCLVISSSAVPLLDGMVTNDAADLTFLEEKLQRK